MTSHAALQAGQKYQPDETLMLRSAAWAEARCLQKAGYP
jgi:hypothetical protein